MAIHKMTMKAGQKPTEEQREHIRRASSLPITYDDDCPELTEEQYEAFARKVKKSRGFIRIRHNFSIFFHWRMV